MANFNIHEYLKHRKSLIDRALARYLKACAHHPQTLHNAIRYGLFPGGKRFRPILLLACGEIFGAKHRLLLPFACALEMIHTYSIIHDDLPALDNDDLRRGELAAHKAFGEGIALLAGDALLTEAFHLMTRPEVVRSLESTLVLGLIHEIAHAAGTAGMVGGQVVDLESEGKEVDIATVDYIHVRKTGALIHTAARVGAKIGGASGKDLRRVSRYAEFLGLAFQVTDDILDAEGLSATTGQSEGNDREKRKATYPSVVGVAAAKERVHELLENCLKEVEGFGREADPLRGIARYVTERVH
ncbi:MAG: polyprenyl synthetase family protein [Deltaproteobacteria bacterium]|nr:polyprenyl synthetase family protein [Deltaproteobacteria bacterium]